MSCASPVATALAKVQPVPCVLREGMRGAAGAETAPVEGADQGATASRGSLFSRWRRAPFSL